VNVLEDVRPPLSRPQAAGDGHVTLDGFHLIPTRDAAVGIDDKVAKFAHASFSRSEVPAANAMDS
jgi:hypothetical protein